MRTFSYLDLKFLKQSRMLNLCSFISIGKCYEYELFCNMKVLLFCEFCVSPPTIFLLLNIFKWVSFLSQIRIYFFCVRESESEVVWVSDSNEQLTTSLQKDSFSSFMDVLEKWLNTQLWCEQIFDNGMGVVHVECVKIHILTAKACQLCSSWFFIWEWLQLEAH